MFIMCFVSICLQDWVCCRENADQLVYLPPLQVSQGNLFILNLTDHFNLLEEEIPQVV